MKANLFSRANLDKIKVKNFQPFSYLKLKSQKKKLRIEFGLKMLERASKKEMVLHSTFLFDKKLIKSNKDIMNRVRKVIIYTCTHEIDECLMFGNRRIFDPHKKKK